MTDPLVHPRVCDCPHGFPICAHGLEGATLLFESRRLSAIAGWPGPVTDAALAVASQEWAAYAPPPIPLDPPAAPTQAAVRMSAPLAASAHDCGCGGKPAHPQ